MAAGKIPTGSYIDVSDPIPEPEYTPEQMRKIDAEITAGLEEAKKKVKAAGAPEGCLCNVCGFEAKSRAGLGSHMRKHK